MFPRPSRCWSFQLHVFSLSFYSTFFSFEPSFSLLGSSPSKDCLTPQSFLTRFILYYWGPNHTVNLITTTNLSYIEKSKLTHFD